jgi:hypothetical protein
MNTDKHGLKSNKNSFAFWFFARGKSARNYDLFEIENRLSASVFIRGF